MTLRDLLIEGILFCVMPEQLIERYSVSEHELQDLSDVDLFELYERVRFDFDEY